MPIELGQIEAIFRYPVKSMRGEPLDAAALGWQGIDGDRRFAFRRLEDRGEFPWLNPSKLPELVRFTPQCEDGGLLPTHVRTPEGELMPVFGEALAADVSRRCGAPVEMMRLKHGIFDEATISVITTDTVREIARLAGVGADVRRFRPNLVVRSTRAVPFEEDDWLGGLLTFGEADDAPAVAVTMRDLRCALVNHDPDGGGSAPEVMKAVVRANDNYSGVYATVTRIGRLAVGQTVLLHPRGGSHLAFEQLRELFLEALANRFRPLECSRFRRADLSARRQVARVEVCDLLCERRLLEHDGGLAVEPLAARVEVVRADERDAAIDDGVLGVIEALRLTRVGRSLALPLPDFYARTLRTALHLGARVHREQLIVVATAQEAHAGLVVGLGTIR